ncbi:ankyrin repeat domain-containing protein 26 isoform X6 [Danio rerio]|uniref:Ankyrin repeat domain-containing protein 26 isoform X6 n=1 Tax=Danio rerio TaxID=7955 RepID=A0AC58IWH1_DANRE
MKKIFNFKKKKGSPSASETASVLSASYDVKEKDLGKVHKAAFSGDVVKLRQLAKKNDLNQLDKENRTALHIACACGHTDVVQYLVESKVKLNLCDNQNRSALMKAVQCEQDRSVSLLLEHEADPNLVDINGNTALHLSARIPSLPVALQLLEHSANINAQNKDGNTPLMLALMENHADMTELLLKEGADVNVKNQEQRSALMIAACNGQISMVRLLLQYDADITVKDDKGWSSDDYAVMNGHHACSHLIIEHGTKKRALQSPSHFTANKKKRTSALGSPGGLGAGLPLGGPALDKDAAGSSSVAAGKDTEDNSHTDSISRASKSGAADSWPSSDEDEELDLSPKKQKVNLKKLISSSKREKIDEGQSELTELPSGSKPEGNESPEDESEEGEEEEDDEEEDEDGEEEEEEEEEEEDDEDDEEEEDDDEEEDEDGDEDDEEVDEAEEAAAACETADIPELPKMTTPDVAEAQKAEQLEAAESVNQPEQEVREDRMDQEQEEMDVKEIISGKPLLGGPIPRIPSIEDGCLVSAVRVEARFSDEEDNEDSRASGQSVDRKLNKNPVESKNEKQSDDDNDWEDDDENADEELLRTEKASEVEESHRATLKCEDPPDDCHIGNQDIPSASPKSKAAEDEDDWDDVDEEEETQPKKPLNLFLTLLGQKEPDSPEVSWESGSDKSDGTQVGDEELNQKMPSAEKDQQEEVLVEDESLFEPVEHLSQSPLHEEADHSDDSESIPVSMIVGQSDEDQSVSQGEDSQVKQMQYDFVSGSVKVSEIDQVSDVSDDEFMLEEDDRGADAANQLQTSNLSNSSPKRSTTSSPAQQEQTVLMRSLSCSPKPSNARSTVPTSPKCPQNPSSKHSSITMSPVSTSPKSPINASPKESLSPNQVSQHSVPTSPVNPSRSPSPQDCSPSPSTSIHHPSQKLLKGSQDINRSTKPESQHSGPNSQIDGELLLELENKHPAGAIEAEAPPQEDIPYTVIDDVDLTSDSDEEEDGKGEEIEELHESVMEERCSKQASLQEEVLTEDEDEEEDEEEEVEREEICKKASDPQDHGSSKEMSRDFLSELGLEKEDENDDSPWDSESGSESPQKKQANASHTPSKSHKSMSSICEENTEVAKNDDDDDDDDAAAADDDEEKEIPAKVIKREPVSVLSKLMDSKEANKKTDLMEELGLGDADDLEDASDWDSASTTSKASKNLPVHKLEEEPVFESLEASTIAHQQQDMDSREHEEASPEVDTPTALNTAPLPSPRSLNSKPRPLPRLRNSDSNHKPESEESDWDTDNSSPAKTTFSLPNVAADTVHQEDLKDDPKSESSSDASDHEDQGVKEVTDGMRGELQPGVFWDSGGSRGRAALEQGKGRKSDTTSAENLKPPEEGMADSRSLGREACVSPRQLGRSARSTDRAAQHDEEDEKQEENTAIGSPVTKLHVGKPSQPASRHNGDLESVFDDSTLSELSEDDRRSPSSRRKKEQSTGELEMADDFEDLTQSSDTATEDLETPVSGYRNASLLFKQLDSSYLDSVSVVKLQNMFHEYERTIQRERDRHSRLADKTSQLEQERNELKRLLDEIRGGKSSLEHLKLELETDMNNLKFLLRQEQEKHQSALMLYNKTREQLQRKEEQQRAEAEERHKAELKVRSLELEIRALKNSIKQLEEDRDESQRLLSHERSTRALQEELLNNHLRKQQDIEEENLRNLNKSNEAMSQLTEASDRERELMLQNRTLQDELSGARAELERSQCQSRQEESRLAEDRDALRERLEDARRDMKLSEEALAQTVFQYNGQLSALKAECSVLSAKLEHERQTRQQLEAEAEAGRARLQAAIQEAERCQASRTEAERSLQRDREEHQRMQEKHIFESGTQRDTIQSLSQKLSKSEARANSFENECHRNALTLAEKAVLLETLAREKDQALSKLKELEATVLNERDQTSRAGAKHEAMQERLAQAQSEAALLRQQLEEALNKGSAKDKAVTDVHQNFAEMLNQLRADGEERVHLVEERSRELAKSNSEIREQNYKLEQEKADREASLRQLQQELADCLKKLSMCEASLEVNTRYRNDLEEEKTRTLKDMDRLKSKLQESEETYVQAERRIAQLKSSLDDKEREACSTAHKLEEALSASAGKEQTIRQLEEAVQRLEIENARLEATAKQQTNRIETLQKGVTEGAAVRNRLEDLVTNLQSSKMTLEEQLNREVQKQSMLSHNAQDSQALWEEELKSRSRLGLRLSELEKEKGELTNQMELEKKKAKKLSEQKKSVDTRLEQEMQRNTDLQKEMYRLKTLLKTAKKQLRDGGGGALDSPQGSFRADVSHRLEAESSVSRMKSRVDDLQGQLEREASRCSRLEEVNRQLKEKLKSRSRSQEQTERRQLEDELLSLRRQLEAGVMDQSQAEQYRRDTEERARQEIRHKLEEVNLFLQTQAASQEALEQMKAANESSQRAHLEQRIRDLEAELSRSRSVQQDSQIQRDSSQSELQRYKQLYGEELRLRKSLAAKLDRSNERLAEANTKLLSERQRSKSLLSGSFMNAGLAAPALDVSSLGSVGAYGASLGPLNRSLGLGTPLLGTLGESQSSRVETYLAKMQTELEKNISKELDCVSGDLNGGSARMSPVGSASGSQNLNVTLEQTDPVSRATQQYLEVLKKNYMI